MFGCQRKRDDFARATHLSPLGVSRSSPIPASALGTRHACHPLCATRRRVRPSRSRCQSSHDRASQPEEESATSTGRHQSESSSQQSPASAHRGDRVSPSSLIPHRNYPRTRRQQAASRAMWSVHRRLTPTTLSGKLGAAATLGGAAAVAPIALLSGVLASVMKKKDKG